MLFILISILGIKTSNFKFKKKKIEDYFIEFKIKAYLFYIK